VGPKEALGQTKVALREINWLGGTVPTEGLDITVKLRSAQAPLAGHFSMQDNAASLTLLEPILGIAPGQAGVIYDGERVLGGGWITQSV
jgi:tRNA-specific 2-thiouridylase